MKFRLVVIDDEVFVRKGIISSVDWQKYNIEIAGDAPDGISGLELIRKTLPHIVLTDIRMPHMDGLELIKIVRAEMPETKILILSVLEDFQTVRTALRLGVVDYVQKFLMTPEELLDAVLKITQTLKMVSEPLTEDIAQLHSIEASRGDLRSWLMGAPSPFFHGLLPEQQSTYVYLIGKIHLQYQTTDGTLKPSHDSNAIIEFIHGFQDSPISWIRDVKIGMENDPYYWLFVVGEKEILDAPSIQESFQKLIQEQVHLGYIVSIGLSRSFANTEDRIMAKDQANSALEQRFFESNGGVFQYAKEQGNAPSEIAFISPAQIKQYQISLEKENYEESVLSFEQLFPLLPESWITQQVVRDGVYQWVSSLMLSLKERGGHLEGTFPEVSPFEQISRIETYQELREWCFRLHEVSRAMLAALKHSHRAEISKAIEYTRTHYMKQIRIKDVADWVNLSENYFSYIFTKETGQMFSQFLQEIRIEKAKELLGREQCPWMDVGERVGFENPKYFTKIFKKYTGITPVQYARVMRI